MALMLSKNGTISTNFFEIDDTHYFKWFLMQWAHIYFFFLLFIVLILAFALIFVVQVRHLN